MGHHLTKERRFKSDKYEWCPEGFFALKFSDPLARRLIRIYATLVRHTDAELAEDLDRACEKVDGES